MAYSTPSFFFSFEFEIHYLKAVYLFRSNHLSFYQRRKIETKLVEELLVKAVADRFTIILPLRSSQSMFTLLRWHHWMKKKFIRTTIITRENFTGKARENDYISERTIIFDNFINHWKKSYFGVSIRNNLFNWQWTCYSQNQRIKCF